MTARSIVENITCGPYVRSVDHLHDELARIELLIRAQVIRWQLSGACAGSERDWGMVVVSQAEVERYLNAPFQAPGSLSESFREQLQPWWDEAARLRARIDGLCANSSLTELRLLRLTNLFRLGSAESDVLLLCLIAELDERYRRLFAYLQNDATKQSLSVELVTQILRFSLPEVGEGRDLFSPAGNLRANHLIIMHGDPDAAESLPQRPLRIDDRIASYLLGADDPDPRLVGLVNNADDRDSFPVPARAETSNIISGLPDALRSRLADKGESVRLLLLGADPQLSAKIARFTCRRLTLPLIEFDVPAALRRSVPFESLIDIAYREAKLRDAAICFRGCESLLTSDQEAVRWQQLETAASAFHGLTLAEADSLSLTPGVVSDASFWQIDIPLPDYGTRKSAWLVHLPTPPELSLTGPQRARLAADLAGAFQNTETQIEAAVSGARNLARRDEPSATQLEPEKFFEACRRQASRRLVAFAQRIEPRRNLSLNDLVLPAPNKRQLIELRNRIRFHRELFHRTGFEQTMRLGKGLLALFAGASGTGKTMAAEALASAQGVDLYKIDLSAIVSKWIGETEKNLSRVFAEAESSNGWLFFDEGESLFGSRGDIKHAQDRMLNLEVNYLLQRIEEFSGVVILATNLRQNIDDAFRRRIAAFVEFPQPCAESRAAIWKRLTPAMEHRDFDDQQLVRLAARFELSGGNIRNIVLDAMFRACASGRNKLSLRDVADGIAREYQKLGRAITASEFGESLYGWVVQDVLDPAPEQEMAVS